MPTILTPRLLLLHLSYAYSLRCRFLRSSHITLGYTYVSQVYLNLSTPIARTSRPGLPTNPTHLLRTLLLFDPVVHPPKLLRLQCYIPILILIGMYILLVYVSSSQRIFLYFMRTQVLVILGFLARFVEFVVVGFSHHSCQIRIIIQYMLWLGLFFESSILLLSKWHSEWDSCL